MKPIKSDESPTGFKCGYCSKPALESGMCSNLSCMLNDDPQDHCWDIGPIEPRVK